MVLFAPVAAGAQSLNSDGPTTASTATLRLMHGLVERTNIVRAAQGLAPLKMQEQLTRAAVAHARDMAKNGYFAHATPNAPDGVENYEEYTRSQNYPGRSGQNLYHGEPKAEQVIDSWMNSPDHRENILETHYNEIGIGFARGRDYYDTYCVQFFGINAESYPVIINNDAYSTSNPIVHLYLYGKEKMKQMRFSLNGTEFTPWEPFKSERDLVIGTKEGDYRITVELTDGTRVFNSSDSILLVRSN